VFLTFYIKQAAHTVATQLSVIEVQVYFSQWFQYFIKLLLFDNQIILK